MFSAVVFCRTLHTESSFTAVTNRRAVFATPIPNRARRCAGDCGLDSHAQGTGLNHRTCTSGQPENTRLPDYYFLESWLTRDLWVVSRWKLKLENCAADKGVRGRNSERWFTVQRYNSERNTEYGIWRKLLMLIYAGHKATLDKYRTRSRFQRDRTFHRPRQQADVGFPSCRRGCTFSPAGLRRTLPRHRRHQCVSRFSNLLIHHIRPECILRAPKD